MDDDYSKATKIFRKINSSTDTHATKEITNEKFKQCMY